MNPSVDDRLASIIRSLTDVVLPGLAEDASLAKEQLHLTIGHLSILRAHIESMSEFETGELEDAAQLANGVLGVAEGGPNTRAAKLGLEAALKEKRPAEHLRETRKRLNSATDTLVHAMGLDGSASAREQLAGVLIPQQAARALKDRRWFALMGFDSEMSAAR